MSVRDRLGVRPSVSRVAVGLAVAGVLAQIAYPLASGEVLRTVTIASVVLLCGASLTDAAHRWGPGAALRLLLVAGGVGLAGEAVGVRTGVPFGTYRYTDTLGPQVLAVPLLIPLAWALFAYPCLLLGRRLAAGHRFARVRTVVAGAAALASWDLFLDPQMVAAGHWVWAYPSPALPGIPGIPLTNYAGWVLLAVVLVGLLDRAVPDGVPAAETEVVPAGVVAWTWLGSALGNLAFFDRPWVALYGLLAMGVTAGPYLLQLRGDARRTSATEN